MATAGTAEALGLVDTTGQLAADLLVLAGGPIDDLVALGQLELVVVAMLLTSKSAEMARR